MTRTSVALLASLLLACGGDGGGDAPDAGSPPPDGGVSSTARVELGQGTSSFAPLAPEGDEVELVMGPQGGYHVFAAARFFGLDMNGLQVTYDATDTATGELVHPPIIFDLRPALVAPEDDHFVQSGVRLILDDMPPPDVVGLALRLRVSAREADGTPAVEDSRVVTIVDRE